MKFSFAITLSVLETLVSFESVNILLGIICIPGFDFCLLSIEVTDLKLCCDNCDRNVGVHKRFLPMRFLLGKYYYIFTLSDVVWITKVQQSLPLPHQMLEFLHFLLSYLIV